MKVKELAKSAHNDITELVNLLNADETPPKSKPTSKATKKYDEKHGIKAKTYKIDAKLAELFSDTCKVNGKTQSEILSILMMSYIALGKPAADSSEAEKSAE